MYLQFYLFCDCTFILLFLYLLCQVVLVSLSHHPTLLNKVAVEEATVVAHNDIFTIADRLFRVEFPNGSPSRVLQLVSILHCILEVNLFSCTDFGVRFSNCQEQVFALRDKSDDDECFGKSRYKCVCFELFIRGSQQNSLIHPSSILETNASGDQ